MSPLAISLIILSGVVAILLFAAFSRKGAAPELYDASRYAPRHPAPEAPPPELSCFVKGIIRSMRETPDDWCIISSDSIKHWAPNRHIALVSDLELTRSLYSGRRIQYWGDWFVIGHIITTGESNAIKSQGIAFLQARDAEKVARLKAAERAPFEALGCPSDSSPHLG